MNAESSCHLEMTNKLIVHDNFIHIFLFYHEIFLMGADVYKSYNFVVSATCYCFLILCHLSLSHCQEALRSLWDAAFPDVALTGLISEQWKEMGWQGANPSTDFRQFYKFISVFLITKVGLFCMLLIENKRIRQLDYFSITNRGVLIQKFPLIHLACIENHLRKDYIYYAKEAIPLCLTLAPRELLGTPNTLPHSVLRFEPKILLPQCIRIGEGVC